MDELDFDNLPETNDEVMYAPPPPFEEPVQESKGFDAFPSTEPEDALTVFNRAWQIKLDQKRQVELDHEKAVKAKAAEELSNWKQQREIRLKSKKEKNRSEEQVLLETLESEADGSNTWERVTKLIDVNSGDKAEASQSDVGRMRKLFIQLKSEPLEKTRAQAQKA